MVLLLGMEYTVLFLHKQHVREKVSTAPAAAQVCGDLQVFYRLRAGQSKVTSTLNGGARFKDTVSAVHRGRRSTLARKGTVAPPMTPLPGRHRIGVAP